MGIDVKQNFKHSSDIETGLGKERIGQSTATVSLDGTGDFDSIQDAIDFLPTTGGVVYIKEGEYNLTKDIVIDKSNVTIIGSGKSTNIISTSTSTFTTETTPDTAKSGIEFSNLFISGTGGNGIYFFNCTKSKVSSCWFNNLTNQAVEMTDGAGEIIFTGNTILGGFGLHIDGKNCSAIGNVILAATETGIIVGANATGSIISGNIIDGSSQDGIFLEGSNIVINNNQIINNTDNGLLILDDSDRNIISGNIMEGNGIYGIYINQRATTADKNIVIGNIIYNNTTGQFNDNGTNTLPNAAQGTTNLTQDDLNIIT